MPKKKRKVMTEEVRQFLNKQTCGTDTQGAGDTSTTFERNHLIYLNTFWGAVY